MINFADLIGNEVVTLYKATPAGIILSGVFDNKLKRLKYFVLLNNETLYYVKPDKLLKGENVHFIRYPQHLVPNVSEQDLTQYPTFARIIDTDGKQCGVVSSIYCDSRYHVTRIMSDATEIVPDEILSCSVDILLVKGKRKLSARAMPTKSTQRQKLTAPQFVDEVLYTASERLKDSGAHERTKSLSYSYLLGKEVFVSIMHNGQILIPEGTIITTAVVQKAHINGKLTELARYSRLLQRK